MAKRRSSSKRTKAAPARRHIDLYSLQTRTRGERNPRGFKRIMFETRERAEWYMQRRDLDPSKWEILHFDEGGTVRQYVEAAHNERYAGR